jgi:hypothetical protein
VIGLHRIGLLSAVSLTVLGATGAGSADATAPGRDGLIAYTRGGAIRVVAPDGSRDRVLVRDAAQPAWSPGGNALAFTRDEAIWVAAASGARARRIATGGDSPTWSSDGRRIAFVSSDDDALRSVGATGGATHAIGRTGTSPWPDYYRGAIDAAPTGNQLAYFGVFDFGASLSLDLTRLRFDGTGMRVLLDTALPGRDGWTPSGSRVSWSPDGTLLAYDAIDYEPSSTSGATGVATGPAALATTVVARRRSTFHQALAVTRPDWAPSGTRLCGTVRGGLGVVAWPGGAARTIVRAAGTTFPDCDWQPRPR